MRALVLSFLLTIFTMQALEANQKKNILVLLSFHTAMPWTKQFVSGLEEFSKEHPNRVEFFIEETDAFRLDGAGSEDIWVSYIKEKYKSISFDGILVESDMASKLFMKIEDRLYPDIPSIVISDTLEVGDIRVRFDKDMTTSKTIEMALMHNKNLKKIYLIDTDYIEGVELNKKIKKESETRGLEVINIQNFTKNSLLEQVKKLPKDSALLFTIIFKDSSGEKFIPKELAKETAQNSSVPMYVFYSSMLDSGAVGGVVHDGSKTAKATAESLLQYIDAGSYTISDNLSSTIINWDVMKHFGIDAKNHPEDVVYINRPIPVWEEYPRESIFASIITGLLFVVVVMLILLMLRDKKLKEIEKKMLIQSRHAIMGEMLSAIAHQWRQPLNTLYVVFQNYKMILANSDIKDENIERLNKKSEKLISQMSQTIDDFRDFFKPSKDITRFRPKDVLLDSIELIDSSFLKEQIDIKLGGICDAYIYGYPNDLGQCFINILQNSKDALKNIDDKKEIEIDMKRKNGHIVISFYDNGGGIEPSILSKVFEPYVTTKEDEGGTGIGLYMTKTIIEEHMNGKIEAKNLENGACFIIELKVDTKGNRS